LVNFLVSLTSTNSMIRVKDLSVKPDPASTRLDGHMTLVASYQRSPAVRTPPAATATTPSKSHSDGLRHDGQACCQARSLRQTVRDPQTVASRYFKQSGLDQVALHKSTRKKALNVTTTGNQTAFTHHS